MANKSPIKDLENWNITRDGKRICLLTNGVPILDESGNLLGYRGIDKDITERKQMEKALQESEEKFRHFVETSADLVIRLSKTGIIEYVSPRIVDLYGYQLDELIGKHLKTTTPIKETPRAIKALSLVLTGKQLKNFEIKQKTKAGRIIPMEINATPDYQRGKIVGLQGIMRDITERKQAEADLAQSERDYRGLFDMAHDAIILFEEKDETVLEANQRACDLYGYSRDEFIGMSLVNISTAVPVGKRRIKEVLEKGYIKQFEISQKRKDGTSLYVEVNASRTIYQGKSVILSLNHDITERKQAEVALAQSDSIRELLLDIITHDLKNPAGVIYALSEAALKNMPENKFMEVIYTSSGRLIEVLNQTTILSQAAFGETIPKETLSLNALIKETVDEFAVDLSTVEMECKVAKAPDVIIQANPLIREVFKNYISNAIKYAKDGKRIVLETVIEDQAVIVCVKDFGKTIAEADRDQIFERQVQLENGKERGRGLGLAIVKRIAGAHGGEAWVEPNKPQGNSFCLRIPHLK